VLLRRRKSDTVLHAGPYPSGWEIPARFNFVRDVIEPLARQHSRAALTFVDRDGIVDRRSFAEIAGDAARWAHLLRTRLDRGDRVLLVTGRVPAWHGAMLGALKGGLISVPCSTELSARDLAFRARQSGARLVIADRSCEVEIEEMLEQLETTVPVLYLDEVRAELGRYMNRAPTEDTTAGERAFVLYTSGTVSEPRGVVHTHAYTWAARAQAEHWLDAREGDVVWCTADTGWAKSIWNVLLGPWSHGAETVLHEGAFDPEDRLGLLQRLGVTVLCQAPAEYRMLAQLDSLAAAHIPRLRHAVSAGEPLHPDVIGTFQDALGLTIHDGYGQTETSLLVANAPGMEIRPGSMGLPAPGHDVAVIDEDGDVCDAGLEGDIALFGRPPTLFAGYWEARDETDAVFRDGWYVTGDRAMCDEDGYFWFVGREDDVVVSSAYRIGPFEVESALLEHPAIEDTAVVGAPDSERGEIVKAFVVLRPGHDPTTELVAELQEHVKSLIAPYKYPRDVAFLEELPRTANGKLDRSELERQHPLSLVIQLPVDHEERARAEDEAAALARQEAREAARREAAAAARRAAEQASRREAEEAARRADETARRAVTDAALLEAAEVPRAEAEEAARLAALETARREAAVAAQRETEETARREAEAAALREAEEAARREAEEAARREAEAAAQREAEEAAQREAEEAAQREAEEAGQREAEEAARREAEAAAQREAEEAAQREAEEAARREAEAAAQREAEETARREAEAAALREAEETARREAEAAAEREAEETARREAEAAAQREAEAAAQREAEAAAQREAEAAAQREAEAAALREAEEAARREAEEAARREAEEAARREAEAVALREAEEAARRDAEEAARSEAETAALQEAEDEEPDEPALEVGAADEAEERRSPGRRQRRAAEKRRKEEERLRAKAEEARRKRAEQEAKERAKAEVEQRKRDEQDAKERAKAEAEQRKRDEQEAKERAKAEEEQRRLEELQARERAKVEAEEAKQREKEERRRQRELAKLSKGGGLGLGRLLSRDDEFEEDDDEPVTPIENIVERLQPYSRPQGPAGPVSGRPEAEEPPTEEPRQSD
jgi:acetyl-CoA synthetase/medium-chain acyl-CoA synthetase